MTISTESKPIDWATANTAALVPIPTHSMFLRAAGPPRHPGTPAVVVECGHGVSSCEWTTVARQISSFARIYTYDRSGLGQSEPSPLPRTAINMALELKALLQAAKVEPPYLLVAHSYGGVLAREFLAMEEGNVAGMVFQEANSEFAYKRWPEGYLALMGVFWEGVDYEKATSMGTRHRLTAEEWAYSRRDLTELQQRVCGEEEDHYFTSCDALGEKKQFERKVLGGRPISVIKGNNSAEMQLVFNEAVKMGRGTEEQRNVMREFLADDEGDLRVQKQQLELSTTGRLVRARKSGHNVQLTEPELITDEVKWILGFYD